MTDESDDDKSKDPTTGSPEELLPTGPPDSRKRRVQWGGHNAKYESVWTPEMREKVLVEFGRGACIQEIAGVMGISRSTFYQWLHARGKEDFTETIEYGVAMSKAWWLRTGRENLCTKDFNTRTYEIMMRNMFGWQSCNSSLPVGHDRRGGEEDEVVRETVDVGEIIRKAKEYALELESSAVKKPQSTAMRSKHILHRKP